jgi:hypothetical protein
MTYAEYHKNILMDESNHDMVKQAISMVDNLEETIKKVINNGDWDEYIKNITPYDKFLWECNHLHPQKTNPINILQNKKYSSYRETLLLPLWVRIQSKLPFETELLLNKSVVQTIFSDETVGEKDVDGGLAIRCGKLLLPIIVNEDKSGHFCRTSAKNVNGILECFKVLNSNIIRMCSTDNNVTIGKEVDAEDLSSFQIIASLRKENGKNKVYQELNPEIFLNLENMIVDEITKRGVESYNCEKYIIKQKQNKKIRESIDNTGLYTNF